jgi:apolipoprotein N-acyltransferase
MRKHAAINLPGRHCSRRPDRSPYGFGKKVQRRPPPVRCISGTKYNATDCHVHGKTEVAHFAPAPVPDYPAQVMTRQPGADSGGADTSTDVGIAVPSGAPAPSLAATRPLLPLRLALPAALAAGLLLAAAFAPLGIWPLAVLSPALLVILLWKRSLRGSFAVGLVFGTGFFLLLLIWVVNLAWFAWVALAIASAVLFAVLTVAQRLLLNLRCWPPAVAGWWVATEAFRDRWPWGGFPWGRLAMSQAGLPTQGWAAIGGAPLLSLVVALTGTTLAWVVVTALTGDRGGRRPRVIIAAAAFTATAAASCLPAALSLDPVPAGSRTAEIAAIQGNVPRARSLQSQLDAAAVTANHVQATFKLADRVAAGTAAKPDLVIWPENSTSSDPSLYPSLYEDIASAVSAIGRPVLVGEVLQNPVRNAGVLWLPGEGPTQVYVKRQLVPFGEYIPFRSLISKITSLTQLQPVDFVPGHQTVVFNAGQIRLGDVICYEVAFDDLVQSEVAAGANVLAMQSNDATYERDGQTGESGQQLAMARIRAVEFDRATVVASTTGYSAIIAPDGRVLTSSGTWQQAELEARVPLLTTTTLAERAGAWPEWVITGATVVALGLAVIPAGLRRRRGRPAGQETG